MLCNLFVARVAIAIIATIIIAGSYYAIQASLSLIFSPSQRYRETTFGRSFCSCGNYLARRRARSDKG